MQYCRKSRGMHSFALCACLLLGVSGCRHKPVAPPLPQITQPMDLVEVPETNIPQVVEVPVIKLPPVPTASAYSKLRLRRRRQQQPTVNAVTPPAVPVPAPETPPPADIAAIGALSSGGDTSPRAQQEAAELIAANERRINGLPTQKVEAEKSQLSKVRNFQKQAQDALTTGDTEGAKTLATKAKLLLDDIDKL